MSFSSSSSSYPSSFSFNYGDPTPAVHSRRRKRGESAKEHGLELQRYLRGKRWKEAVEFMHQYPHSVFPSGASSSSSGNNDGSAGEEVVPRASVFLEEDGQLRVDVNTHGNPGTSSSDFGGVQVNVLHLACGRGAPVQVLEEVLQAVYRMYSCQDLQNREAARLAAAETLLTGRDTMGRTPLFVACKDATAPLVRFLLFSLQQLQHQLALHHLYQSTHEEHAPRDLVREAVRARDGWHYTALHTLCHDARIRVILHQLASRKIVLPNTNTSTYNSTQQQQPQQQAEEETEDTDNSGGRPFWADYDARRRSTSVYEEHSDHNEAMDLWDKIQWLLKAEYWGHVNPMHDNHNHNDQEATKDEDASLRHVLRTRSADKPINKQQPSQQKKQQQRQWSILHALAAHPKDAPHSSSVGSGTPTLPLLLRVAVSILLQQQQQQSPQQKPQSPQSPQQPQSPSDSIQAPPPPMDKPRMTMLPVDEEGNTPLHVAAKNRSALSAVHAYSKSKSNQSRNHSSATGSGTTGSTASRSVSRSIFQNLHDHHDHGELFSSVSFHHHDNIDTPHHYTNTPGEKEDETSMLQYLIQTSPPHACATPDEKGRLPLHLAAASGQVITTTATYNGDGGGGDGGGDGGSDRNPSTNASLKVRWKSHPPRWHHDGVQAIFEAAPFAVKVPAPPHAFATTTDTTAAATASSGGCCLKREGGGGMYPFMLAAACDVTTAGEGYNDNRYILQNACSSSNNKHMKEEGGHEMIRASVWCDGDNIHNTICSSSSSSSSTAMSEKERRERKRAKEAAELDTVYHLLRAFPECIVAVTAAYARE